MKKCKNIGCENQIEEKRTYCCLKCRNVYVNKYLRDYSKNGDAIRSKSEKKYEIKKCKECDKEISYENRRKSFCDHKCSASYNNKRRVINNKPGVKEKMRELAYANFFGNSEQVIINKKLKEDNYEKSPVFCIKCGIKIPYLSHQKNKNRKFCSVSCARKYKFIDESKNKDKFNVYKNLTTFKFNLKDFGFDFKLVEKHGWYSAKNRGDNVDGVSRDHMFSVKEGFRRLINPLLLAHPANCQLIINRRNQSKCDNCSITMEELIERIKEFDNKYGEYYNEKVEMFIST